MKRIISIFDSLRPADLVALVSVCVIGAFLFMMVTGCVSGLPGNGTDDTRGASAMEQDIHCRNNLKNIRVALTAYENAFDRLPDRGGDLFLAKLYLTGYVMDWDTFICPADASEDGADFVLSEINKKCPPPDGKWHEYENYYMDEDYDGEIKESRFFLDVEAEWQMSIAGDDNRTFEPGEISYAAVWNRHGSEDEDDLEAEGWRKRYEIKSISSSRKKPVVCDDFESQNIDEDENADEVHMVHGDHINVLYSNGEIDSVKDLRDIGEDANLEAFRALRN